MIGGELSSYGDSESMNRKSAGRGRTSHVIKITALVGMVTVSSKPAQHRNGARPPTIKTSTRRFLQI